MNTVRVSLPIELDAQLNLARQPRRGDLAEGVRATDIAPVQRDGAGGRTGIVNRQPLRVVEGVDRVGAELEALAEAIEVLRQRQVRLVTPGKAERRATRVTVGPVSRRGERGRVEVEREVHLSHPRIT